MGPVWKIGGNTLKVRTGLALERLWWSYTFAESRLSLHQCTKPQTLCLLTVCFFITLHLFYFWWPNAHKRPVTLQFMALPCNWRFNSWFDQQIRHSCGVWQWQVLFFYCDCLTSEKFCTSKHSCSYVIIVPWNNIQKRLLLSIFFNAEKALASLYIRFTWVFVLVLKYHVLAQITIYVPFVGTVNAVVRLHQQPWHI